MPRAVHAIWWDDALGPFLGRSYPDTESLTAEEALGVFMGHGVNQEARIGYTNLGRGLVVSLMSAPNCIAVVLENGDDPQLIERCLLRLASDVDFNTRSWDSEIRKAYNRLLELVRSASLEELVARPEVRMLLDDLASGRVSCLSPKHVLTGHACYPEAAKYMGPDHDEVGRVLKDLESAGLIVPKTFGRRLVCRQCGESEVSLKMMCPHCGSEDLYKVYAIFCPHCGNRTQAVIPDELAEVVCQHCRVPIRVSDLHVLDVEILCSKCGTATVDPSFVIHCAVCGRHLNNVDLLGGTGLAYFAKE